MEIEIMAKVSNGGKRKIIFYPGEFEYKNGIKYFKLDEKSKHDQKLAKEWSKGDDWSFGFWFGILSGFPLEDILFYTDVWHTGLKNEIYEYIIPKQIALEYRYVLSPQAIERIMRHKNYKSE